MRASCQARIVACSIRTQRVVVFRQSLVLRSCCSGSDDSMASVAIDYVVSDKRADYGSHANSGPTISSNCAVNYLQIILCEGYVHARRRTIDDDASIDDDAFRTFNSITAS